MLSLMLYKCLPKLTTYLVLLIPLYPSFHNTNHRERLQFENNTSQVDHALLFFLKWIDSIHNKLQLYIYWPTNIKFQLSYINVVPSYIIRNMTTFSFVFMFLASQVMNLHLNDFRLILKCFICSFEQYKNLST